MDTINLFDEISTTSTEDIKTMIETKFVKAPVVIVKEEISKDTKKVTIKNIPNVEAEAAPVIEDARFTRFSDAPWFNTAKNSTITLAGVGGIGSWVAILLSRQGCTLEIIDPDTFDDGNMAGQLVMSNDVGRLKVQAVADMCTSFSKAKNVSIRAEKWEPGDFVNPIAICGFDNMTARRNLFEGWKAMVNAAPVENRKDYLFIDGRLAAEAYQILTIQGHDARAIKKYEDEFLFSDDEAENENCSYKQTSHMAASIAGRMVENFSNFCSNKVSGLPRPVPFLIEHDAITGLYLTRN